MCTPDLEPVPEPVPEPEPSQNETSSATNTTEPTTPECDDKNSVLETKCQVSNVNVTNVTEIASEAAKEELDTVLTTVDEDVETALVIGLDILEFSLVVAGVIFLSFLVCCGVCCCVRAKQRKQR